VPIPFDLPNTLLVEKIESELATASSIDDFFSKEGISGALWARQFVRTREAMLDAKLTGQLGYKRYEAKGHNSGNSRNGKRTRKVRTLGVVEK
jgi:transposase-like protein